MLQLVVRLRGFLEIKLQLFYRPHLEERPALVDQAAEVDAAEVSRVFLLDGQGRISIGLELKDLLSTCVEGIRRTFVEVFDLGLIAVSVKKGVVPRTDSKLQSHAHGPLLIADGVEEARFFLSIGV